MIRVYKRRPGRGKKTPLPLSCCHQGKALQYLPDAVKYFIHILLVLTGLYFMLFLYLCSPNFRIIRRGSDQVAYSPPPGVTLKTKKDVRYCRHCRTAI